MCEVEHEGVDACAGLAEVAGRLHHDEPVRLGRILQGMEGNEMAFSMFYSEVEYEGVDACAYPTEVARRLHRNELDRIGRIM